MPEYIDLFAEAAAYDRDLLPKLAAAPVAEIVALVGESGVRTHRASDGTFTMDFECQLWRMNGGPLQRGGIGFRRPATHEESRLYRRLIRPDSIVRLSARVVVEPSIGLPMGLLECFHGPIDTDAEMNAGRIALRGVSTFDDPILGTLWLDEASEEFRAIVTWCDHPAQFNLQAQEPADVQRALAMAHELWENQAEWNKRITDHLLLDLFSLKNECWLEDGEPPLTATQFLERATLMSIYIDAIGNFSFWYEDGDMFWDHMIEAKGSVQEGVKAALIQG